MSTVGRYGGGPGPRTKSIDCEEILQAKKRLRQISPHRPPTSICTNTDYEEIRKRLKSPNAWSHPDRQNLIWHPQENYIGPAHVFQQLDPSKLNLQQFGPFGPPHPTFSASSSSSGSIIRPVPSVSVVEKPIDNYVEEQIYEAYPPYIQDTYIPTTASASSSKLEYGPKPITWIDEPIIHHDNTSNSNNNIRRPITRCGVPTRKPNEITRPVTRCGGVATNTNTTRRGFEPSRPVTRAGGRPSEIITSGSRTQAIKAVYEAKPRPVTRSRDASPGRYIIRSISPSRSDHSIIINRPISRGLSASKSEHNLCIQCGLRPITSCENVSDFGTFQKPTTRGISPSRLLEPYLLDSRINSPTRSESLPRSILRDSNSSSYGSRASSPSNRSLIYGVPRSMSPEMNQFFMNNTNTSNQQTRGRTMTRGVGRPTINKKPAFARVPSETMMPNYMKPTNKFAKEHYTPLSVPPKGLEPLPPRTPATIPITLPAPDLKYQDQGALRIAPPRIRGKRSSAAFVVVYDSPYIISPRPERKKTKDEDKSSDTKEDGVAQEARKVDNQQTGEPIKMSKEEVMERQEAVAFVDEITKQRMLHAQNLDEGVEPIEITPTQRDNWSQRKGPTFSRTAKNAGIIAGRMSSTRRRFIQEEPSSSNQSTTEKIISKTESTVKINESLNEIIPSPILTKDVTPTIPSTIASTSNTTPAEKTKSSTVPSSATSSLSSRNSSAFAAMAGRSNSPALSLGLSTAVAGTSIPGIPEGKDKSATTSIKSDSAASNTSGTTSRTPSALDRFRSSSRMSSAGIRDVDSTSASSSAVSSASSIGRLSAALTASAKLKRMAAGSRKFKTGLRAVANRVKLLVSGVGSFGPGKHAVKEEEEEEEEIIEEEEPEMVISEEAQEIRQLLLTEGLDGEGIAIRLEDIMMLRSLTSGVAASKILEAMESLGLPPSMILKRMSNVPPSAGMSTKEASVVLGQIMSTQAPKALEKFAEKAAKKARIAAKSSKKSSATTSVASLPIKPPSAAIAEKPVSASTSITTIAPVTPKEETKEPMKPSTAESLPKTPEPPTPSEPVATTSKGTDSNPSSKPGSAKPSFLKRMSSRSSMKSFEATNAALMQVTRLNARRQSINASAKARQLMSTKGKGSDKDIVTSAIKAAEEKASKAESSKNTSVASSASTVKSHSGIDTMPMETTKAVIESKPLMTEEVKTISEMVSKSSDDAKDHTMSKLSAVSKMGMMTPGLGKTPMTEGAGGNDDKNSDISPKSQVSTAMKTSLNVKEMKGEVENEASPIDMTPTCCGSRAGWAKRLAAKSWPACCIKCCIRVPKPPPPRDKSNERIGCCGRFFRKLACCCCKPNDIESGLLPPSSTKKTSLCARLCRALGCAKLSSCCSALSCARFCKCCTCCTRCSPCCRKCCRGSAVADINVNPLEAERRKSEQGGLKSKRASRSMPSSNEVMPQVVRKLDPSLLDQNSVVQAAIPVLPLSLAWFCFVCNILVPGLGTIASGAFCLCVGMPRITIEDRPENRVTTFILDIVVGVGQFFTVLFCLVGWGWSIWWGTIMIRLAKKQKKLLLKAAEELSKPQTKPKRKEGSEPERKK